ncbi:Ribonuclease H-like superfamily [Arabidopsis suecica]|uniref:Ribonuclease H-like superfamily n=1 Tax=Arabidopsis suecica TaxID=45249 RepID=A0A8T2BB61_ARASU|nr:Ribonuclease H-like superfamily [Arabidopsis suecica]
MKTRARSSSTPPTSPSTSKRAQSPISRAVNDDRRTIGSYVTRDSAERISSGLESFDSSHSPFFLHSSDNPGLSLVSHNLDGSNYNSWSVAMTIALESKNKWSFIDGSLPRPAESEPIFKIWNRCNSMVKSWLLNVVNQEIYDSILYFNDAAEVWTDLMKRFHISNLPRKYQLEQDILTLRQGSLDLSTYYTKMKTLWQKLASTKSQKICKCNCGKVEELLEDAETSRVIQFLMGLNDSYANIRGQIINKKNRPSLSDIYNMLDQDQSQRNVNSATKGFVGASPTPSAFQVSEGSINAAGYTQRPRHLCSYCGAVGHLKDRCYRLHGYPPGWTGKKKSSPPSPQSSQSPVVHVPAPSMQKSTLMTTPSTNVTSLSLPSAPTSACKGSDLIGKALSSTQLQDIISYCSGQLHTTSITPTLAVSQASTSTSVPNITPISGTFLSLYPSTYYDMLTSSKSEIGISSSSWVIDSGATHHVSNNRDRFLDFLELVNTFVNLPNGTTDLTQELMLGKGSEVSNLYILQSDTTHVTFEIQVENQYNVKVKAVRSDNAPELKFTELYLAKGIKAYHSCPETPQQNSVVERKHQHILNVARALMFQSQIPLAYWGECVMTAVFLINRLPTPVLANKTPYQLLTKTEPDYSQLRTFGCLCYVSTSPKQRTKFDPRARACVFIGYPSGFKGYKVLDLESNAISISRHVTFHEDFFPFVSSTLTEGTRTFFPHIPSPANPDDSPLHSANSSPDTPLHSDVISSENSLPLALDSRRPTKLPAHLQDYYMYNTSFSTPYPISNYISYNKLSVSFCSFIQNISLTLEPRTYSEAKKLKEWCDAIGEELKAMERTGTWLVCPLPSGKKAIGCKYVFKIKHNADGSIERYKARLVAKGYTQEEGIDFVDTFSPVAKMATVKILLAFAAKLNWHLNQLDVSNAFLNGELDEEIYMELPPGYEVPETENSEGKLVCKLQKSIYGLKQASRQWFLKFSSTICAMGFQSTHSDHTLFTRLADGVFVVILVYVDDIIIASSCDSVVPVLISQLEQAFKLRNIGAPQYFLGLEIARSSKGISICQRKYVLELLVETGFLGCKPSSIPMEPNHSLHKDDTPLIPDPEHYRKLIGKLLYLCTTRPDISFAVGKLCQFSSAPREVHLQAVYKVLRYLKGSVGKGLFYSSDLDLTLKGFTDADWNTCPESRRSVTGYCMYIGDSLVSWKSKKQDVCSSSSAESEYRAMYVGTKELIWIAKIMKDLGVKEPISALLYCDNMAALHIAKNSVFHERTKHIENDCHIVRDKVMSGFLKTMHVRSEHQLADALTKPLYPTQFHTLISKMGLFNLYEAPS